LDGGVGIMVFSPPRHLLHSGTLSTKEEAMMIKAGEKLPSGTLFEMSEGGPKPIAVDDLVKGKRVVIFGLPGAFTPTCSAKHLPGYVSLADQLKAKKVDQVLCVSVNDAFVMGAWGEDQGVDGKVRMLADGSAAFTKALGLELDLTDRGMGIRSQRYSMLVDDGVVRSLNLEAPGKFEVSDAESMLKQVDSL
jgi:peroxiredoxin